MGCAQINITGGGSHTGSDHISFPGGYSATHPSVSQIHFPGSLSDNFVQHPVVSKFRSTVRMVRLTTMASPTKSQGLLPSLAVEATPVETMAETPVETTAATTAATTVAEVVRLSTASAVETAGLVRPPAHREPARPRTSGTVSRT